MGTLTEEIFSRRLGRRVRAGDTIVAPVDYAMSHDVTTPLAIKAFRKMEMPLWDPERVVLVFDHILPANTVAAAGLHKLIREFAEEHGVVHLFQEGICHLLMVEKGFARPGGIIVGADSHSTTYGALGCFAAGMGSTDIGVVFATGRTWFRVPQTIRIELHGSLPEGVYPKDLALRVINRLGAEGANGRLEDLAIVARYFEGRQVHPRTRTMVVPGSKKIYMEALKAGCIESFMRAGAIVMNAGCGPCLGRQHGVLAPGERALSTSNRNYPGRMGSANAEIYLASPAVAAASALAGAIADPRRVI